jgi:hypothetical protein
LNSTFYAFPLLGKGEAFLLRTTAGGEPRSVVVDAGYAGEGPGSLFGAITREAPDLGTIDRLICTHEDADHCGGMPGFIRAWIQSQRTIGQLWLPAIWSVGGAGRTRTGWNTSEIFKGAFEVAPAIAGKLRDVREELTSDGQDNAGAIAMVRRAAADLARENNVIDELLGRSIEDGDGVGANGFEPGERVSVEDDWRREIHPDLLQVLSDSPSMIKMLDLMREPWPLVSLRQLAGAVRRSVASLPRSVEFFADHPDHLAMMLAGDALKTHERIAPIIAEAVHWNIPIRWFDFGRFRTNKAALGGDAGFLTPVNAVEVAGTRGTVGAAVAFLALSLSRANVESLVFLRHAGLGEAPVMFTADSRLAFGTDRVRTDFPKPAAGLPAHRKLLATAFHHAAANNDHGYGVLKSWVGSATPVLYVRNGGAHIKGVAPDFLRADRLCVSCHGSSDPARLVRIGAPADEWQLPTHYVPCTCA